MILKFLRERAASFPPAFNGFRSMFQHEPNAKVHLFFTVLAVVASCLFCISALEWIAVLLVITSVWSAELINTAVEKTVDLVTDQIHPLAKIAKDAAAASVLVNAICSVIVGLIIFLPKFLVLLVHLIS